MHTTTIVIQAALLLVGSASANLTLHFDETPCTQGNIDQLDIGEVCNSNRIRSALRAAHASATDCAWDFNYEVRLITQTLSEQKANQVLASLCRGAEAAIWTSAAYAEWTDIHADFTDEFMDLYTEGGTYLNDNTGNFKNRDGTDPRGNKFYPTDDASYNAGQAIDAFYKNGARSSVLQPIEDLDSCENQALMCCFGRDRQYRDGNGACAKRNCDDAAPGDNSNICYLDGDEPQSLAGDEEVHCHGLVWSSDETDPSYHLRFNSFFYVLMHDHMYNRGYVAPAVPGASMCGCVEKMNPVSRADCSEVDMDVNYYISLSADTVLSVVPENLEFRFRACRGAKKNDLASKVNALVVSGDMDEGTQENIFEVLVGHASPNDNTNEAACEAAWQKVMPDTPYE